MTQKAGEADISNARVVLPAILRPNVPFFNEPGALCNDAQAATDTCPAEVAWSATRGRSRRCCRIRSPGPVHIVQEIGNVLPKVYVYLRGPTGLEVLLKARNSFLGGRRIDQHVRLGARPAAVLLRAEPQRRHRRHPQQLRRPLPARTMTRPPVRLRPSRRTTARRPPRKPHLEIRGLRGVRPARRVIARRTGARCSKKRRGQGEGPLQALEGLQGPPDAEGQGRHRRRKSFTITGKKTKAVKVKFSKSEVRKIRKARRLGSERGRAKIGRRQHRQAAGSRCSSAALAASLGC